MTLVFAVVVLYSLQLALAANGSGDGMNVISCNQVNPVFGDVCLTGGNASSGELLVYSFSGEWSSVCREGFGFIEAQLACQQLGFPFVNDVYEVQRTSSLASEIFTFFDCTIQALTASPASLGNPQCEYQKRNGNSTLCSSGRTTGLSCNAVENITEDHVAIIFQDVATFAFIAPSDDGSGYTAECTTAEPFCSGIHLIDRNNQASISLIDEIQFFASFMLSFVCSMRKPSEFGIECSPEFGQPYLGSFSNGELELTVGTESGELLIFDREEWLSVCSDGFGYLEAQVACTQMGFPFFSDIYAVEMPTTNSSQFLAAARCTGSESSLQDCHIQLADDIHSACAQTVGLTCSRPWLGSTAGLILLVIPDEGNLMEFTLIAPNDQYYITNCTANRDIALCAGVHQVDRNSDSVQSIIDHIQTNGESACSSLATSLTDLGIVCPTITLPDSSTSPVPTPVPTPTITTSHSGEGTSTGVIAGVTSSIIVLIVITLLVSISLWYYSHRTRRTLNVDVKSPIGSPRYTAVPRRHRIISNRRKASLTVKEADWEIPFSCVTFQGEIDSGAFGLIYRGVIDCSHQPDCVEIAIKVLKSHATDSQRRALLLEIDMMKTIGYHRHLVSMLGCCTSENHLALIMEYIPFGNLQTFLRKHRTSKENCNPRVSTGVYADDLNSKRLDPQDQLLQIRESKGIIPEDGSLSDIEHIQLARQIVLGMEHLSSLKIVHRDLATRNILIDHDMILKIADFGLARDIYSDPSYQMTSNDKLPIRWMAVESIVNREFTTNSDVWSFGVVLWEIATYAAFPYYYMTNTEIIERVPKGYRMPKPEQCLDEMYEIMCACWRLEPSHRPSFTELLNMLDKIIDTGEYTLLLGPSLTSTTDFESPV